MTRGAAGLGRATAVMTLILVASGCAKRADDRGMVTACEPRPGTLAAGTLASGLAGEYALTLVAVRGDSAGQATTAILRLFASDSARMAVIGPDGAAHPGFTSPLFGATAVDVAAVGGVPAGIVNTDDPDAPGVLVLERTDAADIMLRLGQAANRRGGAVAFDGPHAVLRVSWIDTGGFGGSWESGAMGSATAAGHFCAVRER